MPSQDPAPPQVQAFFGPATGTVTYVVFDRRGGHCAIVDPVLDYDGKAGRTRTASADKVVDFVRAQQLGVQWILEIRALPSVQINIRAGDLPPRDGNGVAYLRIPVNAL